MLLSSVIRAVNVDQQSVRGPQIRLVRILTLTMTMLVTETRHSLDKGRNKIKSNQCWQSFILNLAIYPDCCVIFSSPLTNRSSRACLSVRPPNRFCQPAAEDQRLDRGADLTPFHTCADGQKTNVRVS